MITSQLDSLSEDAWAALIPGVYRRLNAYLRDLSDQALEDTAQVVLLGVHTFILRNGRPEDIEALVTVICRRKAASTLRREIVRRSRMVHDDGLLEQIADERFEIEVELIRDECTRAAHVALGYFGKHKATCEGIARGRMQGLEYESIGSLLGMTAIAARQAWHRCVVRLKDAIRRGEVDVLGYDQEFGGMK